MYPINISSEHPCIVFVCTTAGDMHSLILRHCCVILLLVGIKRRKLKCLVQYIVLVQNAMVFMFQFVKTKQYDLHGSFPPKVYILTLNGSDLSISQHVVKIFYYMYSVSLKLKKLY